MTGAYIFLGLLPLVILIIASASLMMQYIQWDFKWPSMIGTWIVHNLFFICFPEEVFFRFFLQSQLQTLLPEKWIRHKMHILLPSLGFGIGHGGGAFYGALSAITGAFYGYVYDQSQKISWSIFCHFLFNLCHLLFFTYPASIAILKAIG